MKSACKLQRLVVSAAAVGVCTTTSASGTPESSSPPHSQNNNNRTSSSPSSFTTSSMVRSTHHTTISKVPTSTSTTTNQTRCSSTNSSSTTTAAASFEHMLTSLPNLSLVELHDLLLSQGRRNIKRPEIVFAVVDELIRRPLDPALTQQVNAIMGWQFSGAAQVLDEEEGSGGGKSLIGLEGPADHDTVHLPLSSYEANRQRYASITVRRRFEHELSFYQRKSASASNNASNSIFAYGRLIRDACDLCYTLHDYERAIELYRNKALGGGRAYIRRQKRKIAKRAGQGDSGSGKRTSGFTRRLSKKYGANSTTAPDDETPTPPDNNATSTHDDADTISDINPSVCELAPFIQLTPTLVDAAFLLGDSVDAAVEALEEIADAATCRLVLYPADGVAELAVHRCFWRMGVLWRDVKAEVAPSTNIVRGGRRKLLLEAKEELRVLISALKKEKKERHQVTKAAQRNADEKPDEVYNNASRMAAFLEEMTSNQLASATSTYHQLSNMYRSTASLSSPIDDDILQLQQPKNGGKSSSSSSLDQLFHGWPQAIREDMEKMRRIEEASLRVFFLCMCSPFILGGDSCPLLQLHAEYLLLRKASDKAAKLHYRKRIIESNLVTTSRSPNASEGSITAIRKKQQEVQQLLTTAQIDVTRGIAALFQPNSTAVMLGGSSEVDGGKDGNSHHHAQTSTSPTTMADDGSGGSNDQELSLTLELLRRITRHRTTTTAAAAAVQALGGYEEGSDGEVHCSTTSSSTPAAATPLQSLRPGYSSWVTMWNSCVQAILYNESTDDGCCDYHLTVFRDYMKVKKEQELTNASLHHQSTSSTLSSSSLLVEGSSGTSQIAEIVSLKYAILGDGAMVAATATPLPSMQLSALAGTPHDALVLALLHTCSLDSQAAAATAYFQWYLGTCKYRVSHKLSHRNKLNQNNNNNNSDNNNIASQYDDEDGGGEQEVVRGQRSASGVVLFGYFQQLVDMKEYSHIIQSWKALYTTMLQEEAAILRTLQTCYPTNNNTNSSKIPSTSPAGIGHDDAVIGQSLSPTVGRSMLCRPSTVAIVIRAAGELKQEELVRELLQLVLCQGRGSDEDGVVGGDTLSEVAKAVMQAYTDGVVDPIGGGASSSQTAHDDGKLFFGDDESANGSKTTSSSSLLGNDNNNSSIDTHASPFSKAHQHRQETVALANYLDALTQKVPQASPYETFTALTALARCGSPQFFHLLRALACGGKGTPAAAEVLSTGTKLVALTLEEELYLCLQYLSVQPSSLFALISNKQGGPFGGEDASLSLSSNNIPELALLVDKMANIEDPSRRLDVIFTPILEALRDGIYYFYEFPLLQMGGDGDYHNSDESGVNNVSGSGGDNTKTAHNIRLRSSAYRKATVVSSRPTTTIRRLRPATSPPYHVKDLLTQRVMTQVFALCSTISLGGTASGGGSVSASVVPTIRGPSPRRPGAPSGGGGEDVPLTQCFLALFDAYEKAAPGNALPVSWLDVLVRYRNTHHRNVLSWNAHKTSATTTISAITRGEIMDEDEGVLEYVQEMLNKFGMADPTRWSQGRTELGGVPRGTKQYMSSVLDIQLKLGLLTIDHEQGLSLTYDPTLLGAVASGHGTVPREATTLVVGGPLSDVSKNHMRLLLHDYSQHVLSSQRAQKAVGGLLGSTSNLVAAAGGGGVVGSPPPSGTLTGDVALRFLDRRHNAVGAASILGGSVHHHAASLVLSGQPLILPSKINTHHHGRMLTDLSPSISRKMQGAELVSCSEVAHHSNNTSSLDINDDDLFIVPMGSSSLASTVEDYLSAMQQQSRSVAAAAISSTTTVPLLRGDAGEKQHVPVMTSAPPHRHLREVSVEAVSVLGPVAAAATIRKIARTFAQRQEFVSFSKDAVTRDIDIKANNTLATTHNHYTTSSSSPTATTLSPTYISDAALASITRGALYSLETRLLTESFPLPSHPSNTIHNTLLTNRLEVQKIILGSTLPLSPPSPSSSGKTTINAPSVGSLLKLVKSLEDSYHSNPAAATTTPGQKVVVAGSGELDQNSIRLFLRSWLQHITAQATLDYITATVELRWATAITTSSPSPSSPTQPSSMRLRGGGEEKGIALGGIPTIGYTVCNEVLLDNTWRVRGPSGSSSISHLTTTPLFTQQGEASSSSSSSTGLSASRASHNNSLAAAAYTMAGTDAFTEALLLHNNTTTQYTPSSSSTTTTVPICRDGRRNAEDALSVANRIAMMVGGEEEVVAVVGPIRDAVTTHIHHNKNTSSPLTSSSPSSTSSSGHQQRC